MIAVVTVVIVVVLMVVVVMVLIIVAMMVIVEATVVIAVVKVVIVVSMMMVVVAVVLITHSSCGGDSRGHSGDSSGQSGDSSGHDDDRSGHNADSCGHSDGIGHRGESSGHSAWEEVDRDIHGNSSDSIEFENKISDDGCPSYTDGRNNDGADGACGSEHGAMEEDECLAVGSYGDDEEIDADEKEDEHEQSEIMNDDDDEQSGHDPEVDQENSVIVEEGEVVDGEEKVIKRKEPAGEEDNCQENGDGQKKERKEKHVSLIRFWLHGNRWIDNYEEARASAGKRKLFNDKMGQKWEHDRYVKVEQPPKAGDELLETAWFIESLKNR